MDTSLPPAPADLWPTIPPTRSQRALHKAFSVEISNASAKPLLGALAESVHYEMACAGQWAAKPASDPLGKLHPSIVRGRALDAARLLSIYTAVYNVSDCPGEIELTPDALKASATRAYQVGFRKERDELGKLGVSFNDELYDQVKSRPLGGNPRFQFQR